MRSEIRPATAASANGASRASGSSASRVRMVASRSASASSISAPCAGTHTPEVFMQNRPPFSTIEVIITSSHHHIQVVFPVVHRTPADHDLAVARAMHFDTRIVRPKFRGIGVPENHAALALPQDLTGACVVGGVVAQ